jgi:hypothetical protein
LLGHDGGAALDDRIAASLGERREAFRTARKNWNLGWAIIRLRTSLRAASLGSHVARISPLDEPGMFKIRY